MRRILPALLLLFGACREKPHFPALKDAPPKVLAFVEEGDYLYAKAMKHLTASDPTVNPDGWPVENQLALDLFKRAMDEGYSPAQDAYDPKTSPPPELIDRVRDTMMRQHLCRKRAASTRR